MQSLLSSLLLYGSGAHALLVSTLVGTSVGGAANGNSATATLNGPTSVAIDAANTGSILISDYNNHLIRIVTPSGMVSTLAGSGTASFANGQGAAASFNYPVGVAVEFAGTVLVGDRSNNRIRAVTPGGAVSTLAGSGAATPFSDGQGAAATFSSPYGVALDSAGTLYVADWGNQKVRKVTLGGAVSTLAGTGAMGAANGAGAAATFNGLTGVAVDAAGNVLVADRDNHLIRRVSPGGVVSTLAGSGAAGSANGAGAGSAFNKPFGVAVDAGGNCIVADQLNNLVRRITPGGVVSTLAGSGAAAFANGADAAAAFNGPTGATVNASGAVLIADQNNQRVRVISAPCAAPAGSYCSSSGGAAVSCPIGAFCAGGGAANVSCFPATACAVGGLSALPPCFWNYTVLVSGFSLPFGLAPETATTLLVADQAAGVIKRVHRQTLAVTTVIGSGAASSADGTGTAASTNNPVGILYSPVSGAYYWAEYGGHKIRRATPAFAVTTFAGSGACATTDGTGAAAGFCKPHQLAFLSSGSLVVADSSNHRIRLVTSAGAVTTIAGSGTSSSVDGVGGAATFNYPTGIAANASDFLFVAELFGCRIRMVSPAYAVTTLTSASGCGYKEGAWAASMYGGLGLIAVAPNNDLIVADQSGNRFRYLSYASQTTSTIIGTGGAAQASGFYPASSVSAPGMPYIMPDGTLYTLDTSALGTAICAPCPASFFCASGAPLPCPAGFSCPAGSLNATVCPPGTWSGPAAVSCAPCGCPSLCAQGSSTDVATCSPTRTPTATWTPSPTATWTPSPSPTATWTPSPMASLTPSPSLAAGGATPTPLTASSPSSGSQAASPSHPRPRSPPAAPSRPPCPPPLRPPGPFSPPRPPCRSPPRPRSARPSRCAAPRRPPWR